MQSFLWNKPFKDYSFCRMTQTFRRSNIEKMLCSFGDQMMSLLCHLQYNQLVSVLPPLGLKAKIKDVFCMSNGTILATATDFGPATSFKQPFKMLVCNTGLGSKGDPTVIPEEQLFPCASWICSHNLKSKLICLGKQKCIHGTASEP